MATPVYMLSLDQDATARLANLRRATGRTPSAIVRLLIAQAAVRAGASLPPARAAHTASLLLRAGPQARRLDDLCRDARSTRSAMVRRLLAQCPVPALPDVHLPPVISVVRLPAPHAGTKKRRRPGRHHPNLAYVRALLRRPENEDIYQRLGRLAAVTNRSMSEVLRLLISQAQVTLPPDIHLQDGPIVVRITRRLPTDDA